MLDPICTINIFGSWQLWIKTKTAFVIRPIFCGQNIILALWPKMLFFWRESQEILPKGQEESLKNYLDRNV